jgi:hypothetical protein
MKTSRLEIVTKAKEIIKANFSSGDNRLIDGEVQDLFDIINKRTRVRDLMTPIYKGDGLIIYISYSHRNFAVFGLTGKEFSELNEYYESLKKVRIR